MSSVQVPGPSPSCGGRQRLFPGSPGGSGSSRGPGLPAPPLLPQRSQVKPELFSV